MTRSSFKFFGQDWLPSNAILFSEDGRTGVMPFLEEHKLGEDTCCQPGDVCILA
jgi:hypothetical protein